MDLLLRANIEIIPSLCFHIDLDKMAEWQIYASSLYERSK
jgi:hypothetical protein